ncbi:MAG: DUF5053 domain-containing protein [Prevotellaceae bacterium]|jgi:hypothetical protein|nr:DUF5053 domain-containing protein [Prevotellaceae bacterium]
MNDKFEKLEAAWLKAKTEDERYKIELELEKLAEENPDNFTKAFKNSINNSIRAAQELAIKEQLKPISKIISIAYIAKEYFGKSREWLYQRINGYNVNGKPARFTEDELTTLNNALKEVGKTISSINISY